VCGHLELDKVSQYGKSDGNTLPQHISELAAGPSELPTFLDLHNHITRLFWNNATRNRMLLLFYLVEHV
jgi:hypothetical protein